MDRAFLKYLTEIERAYLVLPKALRIRVENWVEKLTATGTNPIWKRHRNAYCRLLLNMVLARNLEEPFHTNPPDGPLASFPIHLRAKGKNLLGPHETSFWKSLYNKVQDNYGVETSVATKEHSEGYFSESESPVNRSQANGHGGASKKLPPFVNVSREIQNLNILIREQDNRVKLLEDQLADERTKHELQLQRLHYSHRIEVGRLQHELQDVRESVFQEFSTNKMDMSGTSMPGGRNLSFVSFSNHGDASQRNDLGRTMGHNQGYATRATGSTAGVGLTLGGGVEGGIKADGRPQSAPYNTASHAPDTQSTATGGWCSSGQVPTSRNTASGLDTTVRLGTAVGTESFNAGAADSSAAPLFTNFKSSAEEGGSMYDHSFNLNNMSAAAYDITPRKLAVGRAAETLGGAGTGVGAAGETSMEEQQQEIEFLSYLDKFQSDIHKVDTQMHASSPYRR